MKTLTIELWGIKHPFKGKMTMDQIYLASQGQDGQHQLKLRVPVLPDDGPLEINRSLHTDQGNSSHQHQLPIPGQRQKCLFPAQLCFFFIRLPRAEQYMH